MWKEFWTELGYDLQFDRNDWVGIGVTFTLYALQLIDNIAQEIGRRW